MMDSLNHYDLGKVFAMQGDTATTAQLLISLAVKFQEYGNVLFIDANHQFNPSFVRRNYHKNLHMWLQKLKVARPFTATQLVKLINNLHKTIPQCNAKAIVISGIDKLFLDPEIAPGELPFTVSEAMQEIAHVTQKFDTFTLISLTEPKNSRQVLIREKLLPYVNTCCKV